MKRRETPSNPPGGYLEGLAFRTASVRGNAPSKLLVDMSKVPSHGGHGDVQPVAEISLLERPCMTNSEHLVFTCGEIIDLRRSFFLFAKIADHFARNLAAHGASALLDLPHRIQHFFRSSTL